MTSHPRLPPIYWSNFPKPDPRFLEDIHPRIEQDLPLDRVQVHTRYPPTFAETVPGFQYIHATYDPKTHSLTIAWGRALHECVSGFFTTYFARFLKPRLSRAERSRVQWGVGRFMMESTFYARWRKGEIWLPYPDCALVFEERKKILGSPTVVTEVGVSQSYEELISHMRHWLTSGEARVFVLVNIEEDHDTLQSRKKTAGYAERMSELLCKFGNRKALIRHHIPNESPMEEFTFDSFEEIGDSVVVDDWVGPLTVDMEIWEQSEAGPRQRGPRVPIMPQLSQFHTPVLRVTDIIPPEYSREFEGFDPTREYALDLHMLHSYLRRGMEDLAFHRKLGFLRPT